MIVTVPGHQVLADKDLAAEPDDRLIGGALPVVLVARAVEVDQPEKCSFGQKMWLAKNPSP